MDSVCLTRWRMGERPCEICRWRKWDAQRQTTVCPVTAHDRAFTLFYSEPTAALVPAWLPSHLFWAYLTGAGNIAAGIGVLFGLYPRLATTLEAGMLSIITLLVWGPGLVTKPTDRMQWTAFFISLVITCGAWVVADSYRGVPWFAVGGFVRSPSTN